MKRAHYAAGCIAAAGVLLSACGGASTSATTSEPSSASSTTIADREAAGMFYNDTRVCVTNTLAPVSDQPGDSTTLRWTTYEAFDSYKNDLAMRRGQTACATGTNVSGWDVEGTIWPAGGGLSHFRFRNLAIGTPEGQLYNLSSDPGEFDLPEGYSQQFDLFCASILVERKPDSASYKEIALTVLPTVDCTPEPDDVYTD